MQNFLLFSVTSYKLENKNCIDSIEFQIRAGGWQKPNF